jgi:hypothetical protein
VPPTTNAERAFPDDNSPGQHGFNSSRLYFFSSNPKKGGKIVEEEEESKQEQEKERKKERNDVQSAVGHQLANFFRNTESAAVRGNRSSQGGNML